MSKHFDVVVIGGGTAAGNVARICAEAGRSVAMVEEQAYGGTCPIRGCDPKKMLRRGAEVIDAARRMQGKGIDTGDLRIDWQALVAFKDGYTDSIPGRMESALRKRGVATLHGAARFVGRNAISVNSERLEARHIVVATGARPRPLDIPGAEHLVTSDVFMEMAELPRRILFVGGGYISFEFAHIAARAGHEVHLIHRSERPLKAFDGDLVARLVEHSREIGIAVALGADVKSIEQAGGEFAVRATASGGEREWRVDLVVHGAGRVADVDGLDLAAAGIDATEAGITVDEHLRSVSNAAVYAAGDAAATPGPPLTPVAALEGKVVATNILHGKDATADYTGVPSVVFTIPELTRVGLLESEARDRGLDVRVVHEDAAGWYSNRRVGEDCAGIKVLIDKSTDRVVGAHLLGPGYAELVNIFALAMKLNLTGADLKGFSTAYPSVVSDLGSML